MNGPRFEMDEEEPFESDLSRYGALGDSLKLYANSIERAMSDIAARLKTDQYAEHAARHGDYPAEELEYLRKDLNQKIQGPIARAMRGSALVVLFSAYESTRDDVAGWASEKMRCARKWKTRKEENPLQMAADYFSSRLGFELFSRGTGEQSRVDDLRLLRNAFVHHGSKAKSLPGDLVTRLEARRTPFEDGDFVSAGQVWIPSVTCIRAYASLLGRWARELYGRGVEATGPEI